MENIIQEVRNGRQSHDKIRLNDADIAAIWEVVSNFVEKQMKEKKAVRVPGLGLFSWVQAHLDISGKQAVPVERPVFQLSERLVNKHRLISRNHFVTGSIPVVPLNFFALSLQTPWPRDVIESCVSDVVGAMSRVIAGGRNVSCEFPGVGRLQIRQQKVKMRFFRQFLHSLEEEDGQLIGLLRDRPHTGDSVVSETSEWPEAAAKSSRGREHVPLASIAEDDAPQSAERPPEPDPGDGRPESNAQLLEPEPELDVISLGLDDEDESCRRSDNSTSTRSSMRGRTPLTLPRAAGVCFDGPQLRPDSAYALIGTSSRNSSRPDATDRLLRSWSEELPRPGDLSLMATTCAHNFEQQLCHACRQRDARNVIVSLKEERKAQEDAEDAERTRLNAERRARVEREEQRAQQARRDEERRTAAFNHGVATAVQQKRKSTTDNDFRSSFIFSRRPPTPPEYVSRSITDASLQRQIEEKREKKKTEEEERRSEEFGERRENEAKLAAERDRVHRERLAGMREYADELDAQKRERAPQLPGRQPDSSGPVFGRNQPDAAALQRKREQLELLQEENLRNSIQRKRADAVRRVLSATEAKEKLAEAQKGLRQDLRRRFDRDRRIRTMLQEDWRMAREWKLRRERNEREARAAGSEQLHEACRRHERCQRCQRSTDNKGTFHFWKPSQAPKGLNLMT